MHDHYAEVMARQTERRLAAAAERRRSVLEAVERRRTHTESHIETHADADRPASWIRSILRRRPASSWSEPTEPAVHRV